MRYVVDTNVAIIANGRSDTAEGGKVPSIDCRLATLNFLEKLRNNGRIVLDLDGAIQAEYHRHLNPRGQPGVGDRFYQEVLNSAPERIERVELPRNADGEYKHFPSHVDLQNFDKGDRKFAALSCKEGIPVANATDSDWLNFRDILAQHHISIEFVCGCDQMKWFSK